MGSFISKKLSEEHPYNFDSSSLLEHLSKNLISAHAFQTYFITTAFVVCTEIVSPLCPYPLLSPFPPPPFRISWSHCGFPSSCYLRSLNCLYHGPLSPPLEADSLTVCGLLPSMTTNCPVTIATGSEAAITGGFIGFRGLYLPLPLLLLRLWPQLPPLPCQLHLRQVFPLWTRVLCVDI